MNFQTINPILIRKGRLRPPIGFVLSKSFHDYAHGYVLLTKTCYCSQLYGRFQQKYETPYTEARRRGAAQFYASALRARVSSMTV